MNKRLIAILVSLIVLISACSSAYGSWPEEHKARKEITQEVKSFALKYGFKKSDYYKNFSSNKQDMRRVCVYAEEFSLSVESFPVNKESECVDKEGYDKFYFEATSYASPDVATPMTPNMMELPLDAFISVIFHEDFHYTTEQYNPARLGEVEEVAAVLVGTTMTIEFAENNFGPESEIPEIIKTKIEERLLNAELFIEFGRKLESVYRQVWLKEIDKEVARERKAELFSEFKSGCSKVDLQYIDFCNRDLNNASFASLFPYLGHFPLVYELYVLQGEDIEKTIEFLLSTADLNGIVITWGENASRKSARLKAIEDEIERLK